MNHNESLAQAQNGHVIGLIYEGLPVRMIEHDGEPWFVAHDIGEVLELGNVRDLVSKLDDDQKRPLSSVGNPDACRGLRKDTSLVNESGLYELIFRSSKPEAKRFRKWVTSEVLPQIRKTGSYSLTSLPVLIEQVDALKERIEQMETLMRPGDDWISPSDWCEAQGLTFSSQRLTTLSYHCTVRSAQMKKPLGYQKYRLPNGQMKNRRSYSPEIVDEICKRYALRWKAQDERDAKGDASMRPRDESRGNGGRKLPGKTRGIQPDLREARKRRDAFPPARDGKCGKILGISKSASGGRECGSTGPLAARSAHAIRLSNDARANLRRPEFPDAGKAAGPIDAIRPEVDDQELVLIAMEDFGGGGLEAGDFAAGEHAEEDGELDVFAMVHEQFEEPAAALVAGLVRGDVVGAEVGSSVVG